MGERDKLRQFRELDDAFAAALRELEPSPATQSDSEPESQQTDSSGRAAEAESSGDFEQRLEALMAEYEFSAQRVRELLQTLQHFRKSA